ncbi:hypothetical protein JVT61DRAFT_10153 [Boletus reticuloceps]|uniref:DUF6606 domain-containing protein n=1 Tax=Boletus reticuloceps TaxID=495285 RepID=A0A8I2YWS1_9AGAM|nr:hypothetical protein JVT61DRAFT_10153 [Boletus reticuloceps]
MFSSIFNGSPSGDLPSLEFAVNHVFFPVHLPETNFDYTKKNAYTLACVVHAAARAYSEHIDHVHKPHWLHITKMLENFQVILKPSEFGELDLDTEVPHQFVTRMGMRSDAAASKKLDRSHIISQLGKMTAGGNL